MLRPFLIDTTLRDGEQSPGVAFRTRDKLELARSLDRLGVEAIEAGIPIMGGEELEAVREIARAGLRAQVVAWNRARPEDIRASHSSGVRNVHIAVPISPETVRVKFGKDLRLAFARAEEAVRLARSLGLRVAVGAEDASRAEPTVFLALAERLRGLGVERLRYADTVGRLEPGRVESILRHLASRVAVPIEFHAHNDFGLATANALAAWRAGARWLSVTVAGLGERAGNAALEEVIMGLRHLHGLELPYDTHQLLPLARLLARLSRRPLPRGKPVVGSGIFTHESGIHVAGVLQDPASYEPFDPAEVGLHRRLILGKHSGRRALVAALGLSPTEAEGLLPEIRRLSLARRGAVPRGLARQLLSNHREALS